MFLKKWLDALLGKKTEPVIKPEYVYSETTDVKLAITNEEVRVTFPEEYSSFKYVVVRADEDKGLEFTFKNFSYYDNTYTLSKGNIIKIRANYLRWFILRDNNKVLIPTKKSYPKVVECTAVNCRRYNKLYMPL